MSGAFSFFATWAAMIGLIMLLARLGWGRIIVYYLLWLAVILLLVTHADELASLINVKALQLNG